jgi:hypothetical protein
MKKQNLFRLMLAVTVTLFGARIFAEEPPQQPIDIPTVAKTNDLALRGADLDVEVDDSELRPVEDFDDEVLEQTSSRSSRISCFARNSRGRSFRSTGPRRDSRWVQSDAVRICRINSPSPSSCRATGCHW